MTLLSSYLTRFQSSNTGYVNLYGSDSYSALSESAPKPLKSIANLTTPISTACFNHDAQILAIASKEKKDALRMVSVVPRVLSAASHYAFIGPFAFADGVLELAHLGYTAWTCLRGRILSPE